MKISFCVHVLFISSMFFSSLQLCLDEISGKREHLIKQGDVLLHLMSRSLSRMLTQKERTSTLFKEDYTTWSRLLTNVIKLPQIYSKWIN